MNENFDLMIWCWMKSQRITKVITNLMETRTIVCGDISLKSATVNLMVAPEEKSGNQQNQ